MQHIKNHHIDTNNILRDFTLWKTNDKYHVDNKEY